jgi:Tol biopolymer transport system component
MIRSILAPLISAALIVFVVAGCARRTIPTTSEDGILIHPIQLTSGFERAGEAYFSPDMRWIIFQAAMAGEEHYSMYVAPLKRDGDEIEGLGAQPIRISPPGTWNSCGYFSPDGRSLIFSSTAKSSEPLEPRGGYQREARSYRWLTPHTAEIYRADGWESAIAAAERGVGVNLAQHALTDNDDYDAECAFSPNGKWIVFASNRERAPATRPTTNPTTAEVTGDLELFAMRADGTNVVRLTHVAGYDGGPFFSPDGRRIVYRSDRKENNLLQVYVADLVFDRAGNITGIRNERQLTNDTYVNWGPYWHPDGRHVIYATSAHGHDNYELYLMRFDGSRKARITFSQGADVLPVFSPDGNYLMWASKRNGKTTQVWLAHFAMPKGA